jgi:excinuclease ABC subunit A
VIPFLKAREEKRYKQYIRVFLRQYQSAHECATCRGSRLRPEALNIRVGGCDIGQASRLPIGTLRGWLGDLVAGVTSRSRRRNSALQSPSCASCPRASSS